VLQSFDKDVIVALKVFHLKHTFAKVIEVTDRKDKLNVMKFCKSFNIKYNIYTTIKHRKKSQLCLNLCVAISFYLMYSVISIAVKNPRSSRS
jgi:hypothetical protein